MIADKSDNFYVEQQSDNNAEEIGPRILIVDLESNNTQKLVQMLTSMPRYPTSVASQAFAALTQVQAEQFDLVLLDASFHQPPAWELLMKLRDLFFEVPIIVFSHDETQGIKALQMGAKDYLLKSEVTPRTLARAIRYSLEHCSILKDLKSARMQEETAKAKSNHLLDLSAQLKAPINVILGFTEIMHEGQLGSVGSAKYEDYIADTHKCATHLNSLLDNMLRSHASCTPQ